MHSFTDVLRPNVLRPFQIRNRPRHPQHLVMGPRRQSQLRQRLLEQPLPGLIQRTVLPQQPGPISSGARSAFKQAFVWLAVTCEGQFGTPLDWVPFLSQLVLNLSLPAEISRKTDVNLLSIAVYANSKTNLTA